MTDQEQTRLLLACPDRPGLIAAVSGFLARAGLNITDADQHSSDGRLFMRMVFDSAPAEEREALYASFDAEIGRPLEMDYRFSQAGVRKRVAIMVSREDHCLTDLLWRWRAGELEAEITRVISNHADHREHVEQLGIPYELIEVVPDTKPDAETAALELLAGETDLLVLARYMQVLSTDFLARLRAPAITEELDAGPIIDQDVTRVSHRDEVRDLVRIGRDAERMVLARAVKAHLEDRVLLDGVRTVVF
jgi:formyltetrahydrofolate deformylase